MTRTARRAAIVVSVVITVAGVLAMVLLLLQPWASCPGIDDVSAGCPVQGAQATVQVATMLTTVVGALGLLGFLLLPDRFRTQ